MKFSNNYYCWTCVHANKEKNIIIIAGWVLGLEADTTAINKS